MALSTKQQGVAKGMGLALFLSLASIGYAIYSNPLSFDDNTNRLEVLSYSFILPTLFLLISIGRLAKHRFFSAEDIDGSGLTQGSQQARILQSIIQNTLEQLVIALPIYFAWSTLAPSLWLSAVPICSALFLLGRILFATGYKHGAPARSFGFALTFYSSAVLLLALLTAVIF
jgi:uncharacterized membrane protein YecN with MAPEG domain